MVILSGLIRNDLNLIFLVACAQCGRNLMCDKFEKLWGFHRWYVGIPDFNNEKSLMLHTTSSRFSSTAITAACVSQVGNHACMYVRNVAAPTLSTTDSNGLKKNIKSHNIINRHRWMAIMISCALVQWRHTTFVHRNMYARSIQLVFPFEEANAPPFATAIHYKLWGLLSSSVCMLTRKMMKELLGEGVRSWELESCANSVSVIRIRTWRD